MSAPKALDLKIGAATVSQPLTPVPSNNTTDGSPEWMCYFNVNDTKFSFMVEETARLVAERVATYPSRCVVVAPETSPIAITHLLRTKYKIQVQNIGKKRRPQMSAKTIKEEYSAVTSTSMNSLYFDGFDEGIDWDTAVPIVMFDNVVTTGGTFAATYRLLKRFYPACVFTEVIVMFTEGKEAFSSLAVSDELTLPIHSLGGHIPIIANDEVDPAGQQQPAQFVFKSSARFPTYYDQSRNIYFNVFENHAQIPAVAVVGPGTFAGAPPVDGWKDVPVRVHDACLTSECFFSCKCDCREQLAQAMEYICHNGGIIVYLFQEGRGIGLAAKIRAYFMQTMAQHDTVEANRALGLPDDARSYAAVRDILKHFKIATIKLMTNNPRKISSLADLGVRVSGRISAEITPSSAFAAKYIHDKALAMGHNIGQEHFEQQLAAAKSPSLVLRFYEPDQENGWLSNFYESPITIEGQRYATVEHYYQSRKFVDPELRAKIQNAPTPAEAFRLAREQESSVRRDWAIHKKRDMFRGLMFKFKQHPELAQRLQATGDAAIIENSPVDAFWGCGSDASGQNILGRMLMAIRLALSEHVFDPSNPLVY